MLFFKFAVCLLLHGITLRQLEDLLLWNNILIRGHKLRGITPPPLPPSLVVIIFFSFLLGDHLKVARFFRHGEVAARTTDPGPPLASLELRHP